MRAAELLQINIKIELFLPKIDDHIEALDNVLLRDVAVPLRVKHFEHRHELVQRRLSVRTHRLLIHKESFKLLYVPYALKLGQSSLIIDLLE